MRGHSTKLLAAASVLALSACEGKDYFADGQLFDSWTQEAGSFIDEGEFGNPTMNNVLVQTGQRGFLVDLNKRFAGDVNPTINFAFNKATLDSDAQNVLRKQAEWIKQFPEVQFKVFGHTDLVGSDAYNKRLGLRRAQAAVRFLTAQGIDRNRLQAVVSFGETQPLVATANRERKNRRTVTEVSGFVNNHPTLLDGKYGEVIYREYIRSASPRTVLDEVTGTGG